MRTIRVYQCELNREIPLEYVGTVKYIGPYDPLSFTNGKDYAIGRDDNGCLKVVDDTEEDYIYDLSEPNTRGGKFYYLDGPQGILKDLMSAYKASGTKDGCGCFLIGSKPRERDYNKDVQMIGSSRS